MGGVPASEVPLVLCVRGPSRSGKTALCTELIPRLEERGVRVAWAKRTHHGLDLPEKATGRVWTARPSVMAVRAPDRLQLTFPPSTEEASDLVRMVAGSADLVLLETHRPEAYPVLLFAELEPAPGEQVIARWSRSSAAQEADGLAERVASLLPPDLPVARAIRDARAFHGGSGCPGVVLGARLALEGARLLDIELPDREKRLVVVSETSRCALDALQAVTGCRLGRRSLKVDERGKLAARFYDVATGRAVRVATRGGLRALAAEAYPMLERREAQRRAYATLPSETLFQVHPWEFDLGDADLPGAPSVRVACTACGEEVVDGHHVESTTGPLCKGCAEH